ncbi:hypothetical protein ACFLZQ_07085, partial [Thermodesulfobacteriota bacterium]
SWVVAIKVIRLMIIYAGGNKMSENTKETYNRKEMLFYKLSIGFIFGTVAIMGIWLLSGLLLL